MPKEIFVSYSSKDRATADAVLTALEGSGLSCWMAPRDVQPGVDYGEGIIEAINRARVMVLIFSAAANASPQIRREVERAVHKGLPIIPVRIEEILPSRSLEYFLSSPHWLDALGSIETQLPRLCEAVKAMLVRVAEGTVSRPAPAPRRLFTRQVVPVAVQDTVPITGLVPPPRVSRTAVLPPVPKPGGLPAGLLAVGAGLLVAIVAAVFTHKSASPASEKPRAAPVDLRTIRPAPRQPTPLPTAAEMPVAAQRTYECREGVRFQVSPETASVSINGKRVGTAAEWSDRGSGRVYKFSRSGSYQVRLSQRGFAPAVLKVVVRSRASRDVADVKIDLKRTD